MTSLQFTYNQSSKLYVAEFSVAEGGLLMLNRQSSGSVTVKALAQGVSPVPVYYERNAGKDFAVQINVTGITYRVESALSVTNAVFSGSINQ